MDKTIRNALERPFPSELLKQRQGAGGKSYSYIEIQHYLDRLNEAFCGDWAWEVVRRDIVEDQIVVEGRLSAGGFTKTGIGGSIITRRRDDGTAISLADDVKKGESDALKRACRLLGVGRELYVGDDDEVTPPAPQQTRPTPSTPTAANVRPRAVAPPERQRLTSKQLNAIWAIARGQGYTDTEFRHYCVENFGAQPEYLSRRFASEIIDKLGRRGDANGNGHAERQVGEEG